MRYICVSFGNTPVHKRDMCYSRGFFPTSRQNSWFFAPLDVLCHVDANTQTNKHRIILYRYVDIISVVRAISPTNCKYYLRSANGGQEMKEEWTESEKKTGLDIMIDHRFDEFYSYVITLKRAKKLLLLLLDVSKQWYT